MFYEFMPSEVNITIDFIDYNTKESISKETVTDQYIEESYHTRTTPSGYLAIGHIFDGKKKCELMKISLFYSQFKLLL